MNLQENLAAGIAQGSSISSNSSLQSVRPSSDSESTITKKLHHVDRAPASQTVEGLGLCRNKHSINFAMKNTLLENWWDKYFDSKHCGRMLVTVLFIATATATLL